MMIACMMLFAASLVSFIIVVLRLIQVSDRRETKLIEAHAAEREEWKVERKELMDRVQAPSFAEYKQGEIRTLKAQKEEKPQPVFHLE